jgi:hypothetical protein
MFLGIWDRARANKENIFYTVLTIFLLERVRRGWNRIEAKGKTTNRSTQEIERKQQWFTFRAALLYALPFLLPAVKYLYRSMDELSHYVNDLSALNSLWAFFVILALTEGLLSIIIYNLLGIYVERMNGALGFFRKLGRSVVDGSKTAVQTVGVEAPTRVYGSVRRTVRGAAATAARGTTAALAGTGRAVRRVARRVRPRAVASARAVTAKIETLPTALKRRRTVEETVRT